jgi:hypothetical protein
MRLLDYNVNWFTCSLRRLEDDAINPGDGTISMIRDSKTPPFRSGLSKYIERASVRKLHMVHSGSFHQEVDYNSLIGRRPALLLLLTRSRSS